MAKEERRLGDDSFGTRSTRGPGASEPADLRNVTIAERLEELLGYDPSIQLRDLTTEATVSMDEGETKGKYVIQRVIGEGGMGRVFLAFDRDLRRQVAIKVIRAELGRDGEHLARFIEEAQITGQLEHPGIPPVHELAVNQGNEVFFTLKLLRGRTLKEILRDLHIGQRDVRQRFSRTRLLQNFVSVANAVHFAHEKGVLHRDIKPANIMIGDYGEVQLMDWGVAKVMGLPDRFESMEEQVETVRTDQELMTQQGQVRGTLLYMSPEQAQGRSDLIDRRSDVYALGATLYEMLTLLPPKTGTTLSELLEESRLGLCIPPTVRAPKLGIPQELEDICLKALEYHPDDRQQTALELAEEIQVYLDGTLEAQRRRQESEKLTAQAQKILGQHEREKQRLHQMAQQLDDTSRQAGQFPTRETKRRMLSLRTEIESTEISMAETFTRAQAILSTALATDADNARARRALGELYLERFLRAERDQSTTDMIFYQGLIEQVNDGSFDRILQGNGSLALGSEPEGASFTLYRYDDEDGIRKPREEVARAEGHLDLPDIAMGSYLVTIAMQGYAPTNYPIVVGRNQKVRDRVVLYPESAIPKEFVYVPAGSFVMYGDPTVVSTFKARARVFVPGFGVGRFPVTCGEYLEFLNHLHSTDADAARERSPRASESAGYLWELEGDEYVLPPPDDRYAWSPRLPVFGVSFADAKAYCEYRSQVDGHRYDLLTESEWEKAAKGVDARYYSWGNVFDNEYANNLYAREGASGVVDVDAFPEDCSPYGVRGMVGNISDWCYFEDDDRPDMIAARGGNWALTADTCRLSVRRSTHTRYVSDRQGFRLKIVLEDSDADAVDNSSS